MDGNYFHSIVNYVHDHVNNLNLILISENYLDTLLLLHNSLEHDLFQESKFRIATTKPLVL